MEKNIPVTDGRIDEKGRVVTRETYDRGTYIETITKVESDSGVDFYVDKESKE